MRQEGKKYIESLKRRIRWRGVSASMSDRPTFFVADKFYLDVEGKVEVHPVFEHFPIPFHQFSAIYDPSAEGNIRIIENRPC